MLELRLSICRFLSELRCIDVLHNESQPPNDLFRVEVKCGELSYLSTRKQVKVVDDSVFMSAFLFKHLIRLVIRLVKLSMDEVQSHYEASKTKKKQFIFSSFSICSDFKYVCVCLSYFQSFV